MAEEKNQNQDPNLRKPPSAGGPRRVTPAGLPAASGEVRAERRRESQVNATERPPKKKSWLKKSLPYLIPAAATGGSIGFMLNII